MTLQNALRGNFGHRKIGLLGGSFNPAHAGHRYLSLHALRVLGLDEIWWLVSPQNPLKQAKDMAAYEMRLAQAEAIAHHPKIRVLDIERRLDTRYTVDTVAALKTRFPATRFVWLMGADNLAQFHRWRQWQKLFRMLPIAVFDRAPFSHAALRMPAALRFARNRLAASDGRLLARHALPAWCFFYMRKHAASGTALRNSLGKKAFLRHSET